MNATLSDNSYSTRSGRFSKEQFRRGDRPQTRSWSPKGGTVGSSHRLAGPQHNSVNPLPARHISAFFWSDGGPKALPKSGICSPRYAIAAIPGPSVISRASLHPGAAVRLRSMTTNREASPGPHANANSMTGRGDLAADRGGALCQTPRPDDRPAGRQRRCAKSGVCRVHNDAALGDAVSRLASQWNDGEVGRLADRRTRVWDLCDAAFREDDTPGSGSRSKRRIGAVEQRANRRTDQQIENPQASHVWPRRR